MSAGATSAGGSPRNASSRSSGGHHGRPSARVDGLLVGRVRQRLERRDVRGRARRPHERGPEPLRLGDDELDRHALDRHADRAPLVLLDHRDDLGQRGEARQHGRGIRRGADHRELLAGVAPAPHVAGRLAAERGRDAADQLPGAVEEEAAPRSRLALAGERLEQLRLASSARCPARSAAARPPPPRAARRPSGRRAPARSRPSASRPSPR